MGQNTGKSDFFLLLQQLLQRWRGELFLENYNINYRQLCLDCAGTFLT